MGVGMIMFFTSSLFRHIRFTSYIILLLIAAFFISNAAYLRNVPQTITQPDGTIIHCFASGDEHYNWLHDKDGYTILADPKTGYYVYAEKINGELVSSKKIVGTVDPNTLGIDKWMTIAPEKIYEKAKQFHQAAQKPGKKDKSETIQVSGTINNIVIFIRFNGESEFTDPVSTYTNMFNSTGSASMKSYYLEASYNALTINSTFYPIPGATVLSFQDSHVRNYYKPYHSVNNPIGYTSSNERTNREHTLLKNAVDAVKSQIPSGLNIDYDGNGFVDNVCFIVYGAPGGWSDLLWPHQWDLFSYNVTINSKVVWKYNFQLQTVVDAGVLSHEIFHTFGAPDLYHYGYDGKTPVGYWDLMEYDMDPPQHMGAFMKYKYGNWITSIPLISTSGTYQLNPLTSATNNCYRINSPNAATEYFVVEYRRKTGTFESSVPGSGLLVYRIKTDCGNGNSDGPPDEVYIYRLDGTPSANGNISQAHYSADVGRTAINDETNPSCFLYNGSEGGLILYDVSSAGATISFKIGFGVLPPILKLPANGADGITTTPLLVWYRSTDALTYDLQISTQADFFAPLLNLSGLTDTTYQIVTPLSHGIRYYWRIKTHTAIDTSSWSSAWDFRIILDSPVLVSPLNNSHSLDTSLTLSWSSVYGADTYGLQVSNTADFSNIIKNISNVVGTTYDVDGLSYSTRYYWRLNASNPGGTSQWSNAWNFSTIVGPPTLYSPSNHEKRVSESGYVTWNNNPIAVSYRVQISGFPDFSVNIYDQSNVSDTFFLYQGFEFGTVYFWRVSSTSIYDASNWSPRWDFTTILGAPILLSPANHSTGVSDSGSFQWLGVNQAQTYNLQVSADSTFSSTTIDQTGISGINQSYSGLNNNTKYYWRVSAHNSDGDGNWPSAMDFTTQLAPPILVSPNNFATGVPDSGTFRWNAIAGAALYKLMLSEEQDFSSTIIDDSTLTGTSYNYSGLDKNRTYYWKVSGKSANNTGEWSSTWNFATSFDAPLLMYPPNNASNIPNSLEFRWGEMSGVGLYHIRVSTSQNFSTTVINDSTLTTNSFDYSNLTKNTRYYWQIRAKIGSSWSNWSALWSFSTSLSAPNLSAPPDGNVFVNINGTLRWEQVTGALNYKLQISKSTNFSPLVVNDSNITENNYNYSNLENNTKYYWRVAAKNTEGTGDWSEVWDFSTRIATPSLISPAQNAIKIQNYGKLNWQSVQGAESYNVQLSQSNNFATKIIDETSLSNTTIDYVDLGLESDYYWHVSASNPDGTTDWSNTWKFTTDKFSTVDETNNQGMFTLHSYPNPASESVVFDINLQFDSHVEISIFNLFGEKMDDIFSGYLLQGNHRINWLSAEIPPGIYFVIITNGVALQRQAIIIGR